MSIERLIESGTGGVFRIAAAGAAAAAAGLPASIARQIIDSSAVTDKGSFLRQSAAALKFPDYFGHNWDAFYDCLTDSTERYQRGLLVIFTDLSRFAREDADQFQAAIATMSDAVGYWNQAGKQLLVLIGLTGAGLAAGLPALNPR